MNNDTNNSNNPTDPNPEAESDRIATAYHESGHAVMASIVGRPVQKVTIAAAHIQTGGIRLGACKFKEGRSKSSKDWLEDEVLILFAGMVAESHFTQLYCRQGAGQDFRSARRLLASRAKNERQLEKLERRLLDKAEYVLAEKAHEQAVRLIAQELLEKETISGRAVTHLLQMARQKFS
jgi:ATP-dependent Zn protease